MAIGGLNAPHHQREDAARDYLEKQLWPDGPVCPKCGLIDEAYRLSGETTREGLYKCAGCREPFTVTVGTIFEDSHIPLHKWLLAIYLMCSSKKGMSAHQLWRNLWGYDEETGKSKGSYKTAWFMAHRIRWALGQEPVASKLDGVVEIDEAFIGGRRRRKNNPGGGAQEGEKDVEIGNRVWRERKKPGAAKGVDPHGNKEVVVSMLQRNGDVRSKHVRRVTAENLRPINWRVRRSRPALYDSRSFKMRGIGVYMEWGSLPSRFVKDCALIKTFSTMRGVLSLPQMISA